MPETFANKSSQAFRQIVYIITTVIGIVFILVFKISEKAYLYSTILMHKIKTACGCSQMTQLFSMHPFILGSLLALGVFIIIFFTFAIYKLIKLIVQTRKFSSQYLVKAKSSHSSKLKQVIFDLNLDKNKIIEIKDSRSVVFCFGLWNPKVCISTGLIKILKREELKAVLLHEDSHRVSNEPMKFFIVKLFYSIFFFLPGIRTYLNKYVTFSEMAADERATNNFTDRTKLASAIFKISQQEEQHLLRSGLALSFFTSTIAERVNKLSDNNYTPNFRVWGKRFLFGLGSIVFITLLIVVLLSDSGKALAMHGGGECASDFFVQGQTEGLTCTLNSRYQEICGQNGDAHGQMQSCNMSN